MNNKGSKTRALVVLALTWCCIGAAYAQQGLPSLGSWSHLDMPAGAIDAYPADINNAGQITGSMFLLGADAPFLYGSGRMQDIGLRDGSAFAINQRGEVVGIDRSSDWGPWVAFIHRADGSTASIGPPGAVLSSATHINASAQVVGHYDLQSPSTPGALSRAFFYDDRTRTHATLGWGLDSVEAGINDSGHVAGHGTLPSTGTQRAFSWHNGTTTDLGTLGGSSASARDINAAGQIVGSSAVAGSQAGHAYLWENGHMTDLGTLGGNSSAAVDLNDAGQLVGSAETSNGTSHAFLYRDGSMHDLGTLGGSFSTALSINEQGDVVGVAELAENDPLDGPIQHAFLYRNGTLIDLNLSLAASFNDIAYVQPYSVVMNDVGNVLLYGATASGLRGVFMLTPIPEPAIYMLMLAGLLALGSRRLRSPSACPPPAMSQR